MVECRGMESKINIKIDTREFPYLFINSKHSKYVAFV